MSGNYSLLRKMNAFEDRIHREIEEEQIKHVADEYTDERVATLLAKMAAARRFWPGIAKVNV